MARPISVLLLLTLFLGVSSAFGVERYDAKTWKRVKTHDMATLEKIDPVPLRHVVGVRFNYRHPQTTHLKPNWFYGSIWSVTQSGNRTDLSHIPVMVAKEDLATFNALPTNPESAGKYVVYGEVLKDSEGGFLFIRLIGTKVKHEKRGRVAISW